MDRSLSSVSHLYWHRRRWGKALILSLMLAAGAIALVVCLQTPMYRASALIIIESSAPYIAFSNGEELGSSERYVETQKELLCSSAVLLPVIGRPEIAALSEIRNHGKIDPVQHLQEHLTISQVGHSELYEIAYESPSPQGAADIVNATLAEYLDLAIQSGEENCRTRRTIDILEEERRRRSLDVERLREKVVDLAKDVAGRDPFFFRFVPIENDPSGIARIHERLLDINIERGVTQDELRYYRQSTALKRSLPESLPYRQSFVHQRE